MTTSHRLVHRSLASFALLAGLGLLACEQNPPPSESTPTTAASVAPSAKPSATAASTMPKPPPLEAAVTFPAPPDVAAPPADAQKTPSGLATKVLTKGTGTKKPTLTDTVKVHYSGWTTDGNMFDSSYRRKEPSKFGVTGVIPGWTEGLQLMVVGEKRRMWIPGKLAYGDKARMGAPQGALTFDVELVEILSPPEAPKDVKKAPADAKKTKSGLAYKILKKGTGTDHPTEASRVTVHYSGWTPEGKLFDSSVMRGQPATFGLGNVIKGWTEGVQLMVVGDKARFWIPAELAYGDRPADKGGGLAGPLVFEIELLEIR
jgi:FKBP-type peptidyl-prolyl cis-trans isomerase